MTLVSVKKLLPNPWRDLKLYPIDEEHVQQLVKSIDQLGFFGSIRARPIGDKYEIGYGHHRVEAAKQAGIKQIDIQVEALSDDDMIRIMCRENSEQKGSKAAAVMNELQAATKRIAGFIMRGTVSWGITQEIVLFKDSRSFERTKSHLIEGNGIGRSILRTYLDCSRTDEQIKDAVKALKDSGIYTHIMEEIEQEIIVEEEEAKRKAEQAERDAEEAAREADEEEEQEEKRRKERAAKEAKRKAEEAEKDRERLDGAKDRSNDAKENSKKKNPRVLDPRCAKVFGNDAQFAAFSEAVTTDTARRFIAYDQQYELAKQIWSDLKEAAKDGERVGAPFIKQYVRDVIAEAVAAQKNIDRDEKAKIRDEQVVKTVNDDLKAALVGLKKFFDHSSSALETLREHKGVKSQIDFTRYEQAVSAAVKTLNNIRKEIQ